MGPYLRIVIVNWNSGTALSSCLRSVATIAERIGFTLEKVVVVDNASRDGSAERLEETFQAYSIALPLRAIRNATNRGFAAGCNQGIAGAEVDYVLLLNPDTLLLETSLADAIGFLQRSRNKDVGVLGVRMVDGDGKTGRGCARFLTPRLFFNRLSGLHAIAPTRFPTHAMEEWDHEENRDVDHVMGAFYLIRWSVIETVGPLDEDFFVFFEDLDYSLRVRRAGWRIHYLAETSIYHQFGHTSDQARATRLFFSLRSRIIYSSKHFGRVQTLLLLSASLLLEPLTRVMRALLRRSPREMREIFVAYGQFMRWILTSGFRWCLLSQPRQSVPAPSRRSGADVRSRTDTPSPGAPEV